MDIEAYIVNRVDSQIQWYDEKSIRCQKYYKRIQFSEIIFAAFIPLLAGYSTSHVAIPIIIGLLGVIITILESVTKLYKFHENWIQYRSTCELLRYQKHLYLTHSSPYNPEEETIDNLFVKNIEQIISSENNQWKTIHSQMESKKIHRKTVKVPHKFFRIFPACMDIVLRSHLL